MIEAELVDGRILEFPDSTPPAVIQSTVKRVMGEAIAGTTTERLAAGAGKALVDTWRGAKQMFGFGDDTEIAESRKRDQALINTAAGKVGNVAGYVAPTVLASMVPGANTYLGAGALGALTGATQPTLGDESRLLNTGIGAAGGVAGQYIGNKISQAATNRINAAAQARNTQIAQNAPRDAALSVAKEQGYVVPPTSVNPSRTNRLLEGLAGKLTTQQQASIKNQTVTNSLARKALGLADDAPITSKALEDIRSNAGRAYEAVKQAGDYAIDQNYVDDLLKIQTRYGGNSRFETIKNPDIKPMIDELSASDFTGDEIVETVKQLRAQSSSALGSPTYDPAKRAAAKAQKEIADALDGLIERNLKKAGAGDLAKIHKAARVQIAKTYTVEKALNPATGNVRARKLAGMVEKGKPLSGELKDIGNMALQFPKAMDEVVTSMPGVSPLDFATGAVISSGTGDIRGMLAPLLRPAARATLLSPAYQARMVNPSYAGPSAIYPLLNSRQMQGLLRGAGASGLLNASQQ